MFEGYSPTLHSALTSIWDETRLFLEIRFQVPQICHMLLMQKPGLLSHNRFINYILERLTISVQQLQPFEVNCTNCGVFGHLNFITFHLSFFLKISLAF
jgi:hypothetical protein